MRCPPSWISLLPVMPVVLSLVMAVRVIVSGATQDEHGGHSDRRRDRHDHSEPDRPAASRLFAQPPALLQDRLAELDRSVGPQRALNRPPVLVDERVPVEAQELGVGAQEPLRVWVAREDLPTPRSRAPAGTSS